MVELALKERLWTCGVHSGISSNRSWTDKLTKKNTRSTMIIEQPNHELTQERNLIRNTNKAGRFPAKY